MIVGAQIRQVPKVCQGPAFEMCRTCLRYRDSRRKLSDSCVSCCFRVSNADGKGQIVVAGDRLQMPSIKALDPPEDATYVVGSIQTYLVERAFTPAVAECPLDENYRSAERIVEYLRRIGYRGGVVARQF